MRKIRGFIDNSFMNKIDKAVNKADDAERVGKVMDCGTDGKIQTNVIDFSFMPIIRNII